MLDNKLIGEKIKEARHDKSLKQSEVALAVGVATSTIARYERGEIERLKIPVVESIAHYLEVNPAWILGKSKFKYNPPPVPSNVQRPSEIDPDAFAIKMYKTLDTDDKAEIRGEMKQMLKADKYKEERKPDPTEHFGIAAKGGKATQRKKKQTKVPFNPKNNPKTP